MNLMWLETQTTTCWVIEHASSTDTLAVKDDLRIEILYNGLAIVQEEGVIRFCRGPGLIPGSLRGFCCGQHCIRTELRLHLHIIIAPITYIHLTLAVGTIISSGTAVSRESVAPQKIKYRAAGPFNLPTFCKGNILNLQSLNRAS